MPSIFLAAMWVCQNRISLIDAFIVLKLVFYDGERFGPPPSFPLKSLTRNHIHLIRDPKYSTFIPFDFYGTFLVLCKHLNYVKAFCSHGFRWQICC